MLKSKQLPFNMPDQEFVTDTFDDRWPEDETPDCDTWQCAKCNKEFIDIEDYPYATRDIEYPLEVRLYWLSPTEAVCSSCAVASGIPPIDKE